jgi:NADPH:quinone reductase-like Zn-dependent oxidoreductase
MKAVVLTAYGDVDKLEWRETSDPRAQPDGIVVRMRGASINPIDWKMRSGAAKGHFPVEFPAILGRDASGEVVEVGSRATAFAIGDRVLGLVHGGYAELVAASAESWGRVPEGIDLADAGALPLAVLTGAQLMEGAVDPARDDVVVVTGALGSVGRVAVHAGKLRGAKIWAAVRGSQRAEAEELGADGVVALDDPGDIARLPRLSAIADTVGGETTQKLYDKLAPGAVIGSVVGPPSGAQERGFKVHAFMASPSASTLTKYAADVAAGKLRLPIVKRVPLAQAAEAQRFAETQHPRGKVLLLG